MEDAMFDVCSDDDECIVRFQLREDDSDALPDMLDIARAVNPAPVNQSVASDLSAFVEERFPEYLSPLHEQTSSKSEKKIYGCEWEFLQHIDAFARVETQLRTSFRTSNPEDDPNSIPEKRFVDNTMGVMRQYFRWLLQSGTFTMEMIIGDDDGVLFAKHVLCHQRILKFFLEFWFPQKKSPTTNTTKIDAMKRFVSVFQKVFDLRVHPQVQGALNDLKKGQKKAVDTHKATSLTIAQMKKNNSWMSSDDVTEIIRLLTSRIMKWISAVRKLNHEDLEDDGAPCCAVVSILSQNMDMLHSLNNNLLLVVKTNKKMQVGCGQWRTYHPIISRLPSWQFSL